MAVPSVNYDKGLLVYFSSTENKLHFSFKDDKYLGDNFILYNDIGQKIYEAKINSSNFEINLSNNPVSGIYFYQIDEYESSKIISGKFLIE